ncbi:hypothetical protein [Micromonospora sp. NPDC048830]|uniref:hypothetical protein n=1 Tax=Micromonospora sp. NPDC048830 TaxID=3364257 RepID=UPI003717C723
MTTVTRETGQDQPGGLLSPENIPIWALVLVVFVPVGAVLWIALAYGSTGNIGQAAIAAIGGVAVASISAIPVVLRRRPNRRRT